jgi:hypothetical protein
MGVKKNSFQKYKIFLEAETLKIKERPLLKSGILKLTF